jgi:hypothetical protein
MAGGFVIDAFRRFIAVRWAHETSCSCWLMPAAGWRQGIFQRSAKSSFWEESLIESLSNLRLFVMVRKES